MILGISWQGALQTISQITTAGVAITAFSLFLFSFAYNLRERVVRAFIFILLGKKKLFAPNIIALGRRAYFAVPPLLDQNFPNFLSVYS